MKKDEFVTFQKFFAPEDAQDLIELLKENGIEYEYDLSSLPIDTVILGGDLQEKILIQLKPEDFDRANALSEWLAQKRIDAYPEDYYLYDFSDVELMEVIEKEDEWSKEDFVLAQRILKNRGKAVSTGEVEEYREKRLRNLNIKEAGNKKAIIIGYVATSLSFFGLAGPIGIFLSLYGLILGWSYWVTKKTAPNGVRSHRYNRATRVQGKFLFIFSIISIVLLPYVGLPLFMKLIS